MTYAIEVLISVLEHCLQIFSPGKKRKKTTKQTKQKHAIQQQKKKTTSKILCELMYDTNHLSRNIRH
jgi:hypothetical protein